MNEMEKRILEEYERDYNIEAASYQIMGKMLDEEYVEKRLRMFDIRQAYIYGGTYMAIQLYRVGKKYTTMKGIVDRSGKIIFDEPVLVMTLDEFRETYHGEKIIVSPIRFFEEIKKDLELFAEEKDILNIGELFFGVI